MIWGAVCAKSFVEEQQHKKCCILRGAWHCVCVLSALWGIHEQQRRRQQQLAMSLPTTIAIVRVAKIRFSIAFVRFLCRMRWTRQSPEVLCNGGSKATFKFRSWRLCVTACACVCVCSVLCVAAEFAISQRGYKLLRQGPTTTANWAPKSLLKFHTTKHPRASTCRCFYPMPKMVYLLLLFSVSLYDSSHGNCILALALVTLVGLTAISILK